ncbi:g300 [Coccomyxa elongata]
MTEHPKKKRKVAVGSDQPCWTENDRNVLVRLVKQCQKLGSEGSSGSWKNFLKVRYPKFRSQDPSHYHWKVLAAFVESLDKGSDQKMVSRHREWEKLIQAERDALAKASQVNRGDPAEWCGMAQDLVSKTAEHPRFKDLYSLPSYDKCWHRIPRRQGQSGCTPVIYGLDCEMCETALDSRALVRVCVVDEDGKDVLDMMVKPKKRILDYRTHITGLTAESFEGVTHRRRDAQLALRELLKENVILVGHALHHDLLALRIDYQPVIDTSLLISYRNLMTCVPSLADLSKLLLKRVLREDGAPHDCKEDAIAAVQLAKHLMQHGPTLVLDPPNVKVPKEQLCKLLVHSLPPGVAEADLCSLLPASAPQVEKVEGNCTTEKKVLLVFKNPQDANQAFKELQGEQHVDSLGRAQKIVKLNCGLGQQSLVKVRKMGAHNGMAHGRDAKQDRAKWKRKRKA